MEKVENQDLQIGDLQPKRISLFLFIIGYFWYLIRISLP